MVQIPGDVDSVPQDKIHIVRNKNPEYRRDPGASQDLALAVINASDVAVPDDLSAPSALPRLLRCAR